MPAAFHKCWHELYFVKWSKSGVCMIVRNQEMQELKLQLFTEYLEIPNIRWSLRIHVLDCIAVDTDLIVS